ncbi:MAG TPA: hypothetical protein VGP16_14250 [Asanoa sp.]|nr:hypothetical protein [Asanoa sp.]
MRIRRLIAATVVAAGVLVGSTAAPAAAATGTLTVNLYDLAGRKVGVAKLTYNNTNYTASLSVTDTYADGFRVGAYASYTQDPGYAEAWDTNGANNGTNSASFPYEPGGVAEVRVWTQNGPNGWTEDYAYGQKTLPW